MTTQLILRALRHDIWATQQLIQHLRQFTPPQLQLTVPGTYGTIKQTVLHIVGADQRYLSRFTGVAPTISEQHTPDATLDELAEQLAKVNDTVETLFAGEHVDPDAVIRDKRRNPADPPLLITSWVLLTQFVHHGSDHRAQVGTILGANGLPTVDIDVWAYGSAKDAVKEERRA